MKTILLTISIFLTLNGISQNMTPVTRAEINDINLRLDNVEKFGQQHRTGNHLIIAGTLLNGFGLLFLNSNTAPANPNSKLTDNKLAVGTLAVGTILSTTGLIINIDSFRHLRK
jgi:hypothetical protein